MSTSDDEALRLNTLHRFRKHSPRLLLQEYSHCEVPAGCGGVVLRWIDREGGLPVIVRVAALGKVRCWIDGQEIHSSRIELRPGMHAVAVEISELPRAGTPVAVVIQVNLPGDNETLNWAPMERWWVTDSQPSEAWIQPGYEPPNPEWSRALEHPNHEAELPENERWRWNSLARPHRVFRLPGTHAWLHQQFPLFAADIAERLAAAEERSRA